MSHLKDAGKLSLKVFCQTCGLEVEDDLDKSITRRLFGGKTCRCPNPSVSTVPHDDDETLKIQRARKKSPSDAVISGLDPRFDVKAHLGSGGMGHVFLAIDKSSGRSVAVKVLRHELAIDQSALTRFKREVDATTSLSHPGIVSVYSHGETSTGAPYLVMEFVDGRSLSDILDRRKTIDPARAFDVFIQLCEAIEHAHNYRILHRDLKPSNILIKEDEHGNEFVKLVDFGIAKILSAASHTGTQVTQTGEIFGTPDYMSPEQCQGDDIDVRSDIYSLGCIMYEVFSGKPPFQGSNPVKTILGHINKPAEPIKNKSVPATLNTVLMHCLEKDPANRYQSISELGKDLRLVANGQPPAQQWKADLNKGIRYVLLTLCLVLAIAAQLTAAVIKNTNQKTIPVSAVAPIKIDQVTPVHKGTVHAIGVYEANSRQEETGVVTVRITPRPEPVTLVLTSYNPVNWRIQCDQGAKIEKVILGGYHASTISGISQDCPVVTCFYEQTGLEIPSINVHRMSSIYFHAYMSPKDIDLKKKLEIIDAPVDAFHRAHLEEEANGRLRDYLKMETCVKSLTGKDLDSFQGAYRGNNFSI